MQLSLLVLLLAVAAKPRARGRNTAWGVHLFRARVASRRGVRCHRRRVHIGAKPRPCAIANADSNTDDLCRGANDFGRSDPYHSCELPFNVAAESDS